MLIKPSVYIDISLIQIVASNATNRTNVGTRLAFRGWNYAYISIKLTSTAVDEEVYIDTGYGVTLADKL